QMLRCFADRGTGRWVGGEGIVVHPGSGSLAKCWPLERHAELIRRLRGAGRKVKVIAGEAERERLGDAAIEQLGADETVWPATLVELHQHLLSAGAYVGNDSGPTHLAGIIGVPTVALFGPTDPRVWCPVGPRV